MPVASPPKRSPVAGEQLVATLRGVVERCRKAQIAVGLPGEGERRFRAWLITDFLIEALRWPVTAIQQGERFDVLLFEEGNRPFINIETKDIGHRASAAERARFEERLADIGTLRHAYFTNGDAWERLELAYPAGKLKVLMRSEFTLVDATAEQAREFFAPLVPPEMPGVVPISNRRLVTASDGPALATLADDLRSAVQQLADFLVDHFAALRAGAVGSPAQTVALELFDLWCEKSLLVPPTQAGVRLAKTLRGASVSQEELEDAIRDLGFSDADVVSLAERIRGLPRTRQRDADALLEALWPAYGSAVSRLAVQTAHVLLARALLYRICEDELPFDRILSGEPLARTLSATTPGFLGAPGPAMQIFEKVRQLMERFLPPIYALGEFDWWVLTPEKRGALSPTELAFLARADSKLDAIFAVNLRMLAAYDFSKVDVDVWRNVYQHFLPAEERQRIGGFYTPDELVQLLLDIAEFKPAVEGLCNLKFLDPACGSGAFVTGALARLLEHLESKAPCHAHVHVRGQLRWQQAQAILTVAAKNLHAVDIHPFAAFLTTVNVLFLLMPLYVSVREKNPEYTLDLNVFSADSLEKPDSEELAPDLFAKLNSRIQLSQLSLERYKTFLETKVDRVFGNPPWGGILKGRLAPVYDEGRKKRLKLEYPLTAIGKYDIYGLFIERCTQLLSAGGRFALVTQDTFLEKEWAKGVRSLLTSKCELRDLIDLNPFGQLFFHAMNTPCLVVADRTDALSPEAECVGLLSSAPRKAIPDDQIGRLLVAATVREVVAEVVKSRRPTKNGFAEATILKIERLRETAPTRWDLRTQRRAAARRHPVSVADVLNPFQGVTPGGKGCLKLFLLKKAAAKEAGIESSLLHEVVKGREIQQWAFRPGPHVLLYPYIIDEEGGRPAFALTAAQLRARGLKNVVTDALDLRVHLDSREADIVGSAGLTRKTIGEVLQHRRGFGIVKFANAAEYLAEHYDRLSSRKMKKRNIRTFGREWYEFAWPRDARVMLKTPKIVSPRLTPTVRFAIDDRGVVPQDSCVALVPRSGSGSQFEDLSESFEKVLGRKATELELLEYLCALLNSSYAQEQLITGRRPTPRGSYQVNDAFLQDIPVPLAPDKDALLKLLDDVRRLRKAKDDDEKEKLARAVDALARKILR